MPTVSFELEIYSYQIYLLGHVNNAIYIQWMEIGRTNLLEAIGLPTQDIFKQGFAPVLVHTSITYKMPLYYRDGDLYMFEEMQTADRTEFRRSDVNNLYDVFVNIRDDEGEHVKTMVACQQPEAQITFKSPHTVAQSTLLNAPPALSTHD